MSRPECRRCQSTRLLALDKKREEDNYVYRCRDCGFLFSPPPPPATHPAPQPRHTAMEPGRPGGSP